MWAGQPRSSPQTERSYWETSQDPAGAYGGQRRQGSREAGAVRLQLEASSGPAQHAGAESPPLPTGSTQKKTEQRKQVSIK